MVPIALMLSSCNSSECHRVAAQHCRGYSKSMLQDIWGSYEDPSEECEKEYAANCLHERENKGRVGADIIVKP